MVTRLSPSPVAPGRGSARDADGSGDDAAIARSAHAGDVPLEAQRDLQRFTAMLELMPGYCYTVDRDLVFTSSAGKGLEQLQLVPGQVIGLNLKDLWGTHDDNYEPLVCHRRALAGGESRYSDFCLGRSLEYLIRPLRAADGSVVGAIGVALDVTDMAHAREQQAKLTAQLLQGQKLEALGRLAGGVAHDFNNFLTCIMGNLALLERHVSHAPEVDAFLTQANAAVDSAASLTRQLLAFTRKQVISPRPIQLNTLIARLATILQRLAGHRIGLSLDCGSELWNVNADPGQIEQVVVNLVMNARDAIADQGKITIETRNLELGADDELPAGLGPGQYVRLSVTDNGRGLTDVVKAHLFEPFFTTKESGAGTGLGLANARDAVLQNGGVISVESEHGKGSAFRVFLPRVHAPAASETTRPSRARLLDVAGGTETILLVDDEPLVLDLAQRTLQALGYNVLPCAGPDDALRTFAEYQNRIDLLVTDLVMRRMNGKELAGRISALSPSVVVLFSSGHGESLLSELGVQDDGLHFIAKPYRPDELAVKVRGLLDRRDATRP